MITGNGTDKPRKWVPFSEATKREVIEAVVSGRMKQKEARIKYGIKGETTILKWIRKYQGVAMSSNQKSTTVQQLNEENANLKADKKLLEDALLKSAVKIHCLESILGEVEAQYGPLPKKNYPMRS